MDEKTDVGGSRERDNFDGPGSVELVLHARNLVIVQKGADQADVSDRQPVRPT